MKLSQSQDDVIVDTLIAYVKSNTNKYAVDCKEQPEQQQPLKKKHRHLQKPFYRQRDASLIDIQQLVFKSFPGHMELVLDKY